MKVVVEKMEFRRNVEFFKADERIVSGIVIENNVEDSQGDIVSDSEEIVKAAHDFMENVQSFRLGHEKTFKDLNILESYISPITYDVDGATIKKGSWVLTLRILDNGVWQKIKQGKINGFSIGGKASSEAVTKGASGMTISELFEVYGVSFDEKDKGKLPPDLLKKLEGSLKELIYYKDDLPTGLEDAIKSILTILAGRLETREDIKKSRSWPSFDFLDEYDADDDDYLEIEKCRGNKFPTVTRAFGLRGNE